MTEEEFVACWEALEPTPRVQTRMERRVANWLEAERTPLWDEWATMLRTAPVKGLSFSFAGAAALLLTTPLLSMLQLLN